MREHAASGRSTIFGYVLPACIRIIPDTASLTQFLPPDPGRTTSRRAAQITAGRRASRTSQRRKGGPAWGMGARSISATYAAFKSSPTPCCSFGAYLSAQAARPAQCEREIARTGLRRRPSMHCSSLKHSSTRAYIQRVHRTIQAIRAFLLPSLRTSRLLPFRPSSPSPSGLSCAALHAPPQRVLAPVPPLWPNAT